MRSLLTLTDCYGFYNKFSQFTSKSMTSLPHVLLSESSQDEDLSVAVVTKALLGRKQSSLHVANSISPLESEKVYDDKLFDVLKVEPEDFSTQITLLDWPVFKRITPEELTSCAWNTRSKLEKAYNIVQFIRRFNHTNFWIQREILHAQTLKTRTEILAHFIKVAKRLLEINNLNGLMAVITALQSAPIYRLHSTWSGLSKRDRSSFNTLAELVSEKENRRKFRDYLATTKLPCIPFLGLYLTDLVYIDTLHPHHGGLESNQRRNQMNNICRVISEFQQSDYGFLKPLDHVQNYLISVRYIEELQKFAEDDNYKLSLALEPVYKESLSTSHRDSSCCPSTYPKISKSVFLPKPHHRKTLSDGVCSVVLTSDRSNSLPVRMKQKLNLLDDSVVEECCSSTSSGENSKLFKWLPGLCNEAISAEVMKKMLKDCIDSSYLSPVLSRLHTLNFEFEGALWRKRILKFYKKPRFSHWRRIWAGFCDNHLLFFKQKPFHRGSTRMSFYKEPYKCYPVTARCMIVLTGENEKGGPSNREFQLNDLNRGNMFKFRANTSELALSWFQHLVRATQRPAITNQNVNLMLFD